MGEPNRPFQFNIPKLDAPVTTRIPIVAEYIDFRRAARDLLNAFSADYGPVIYHFETDFKAGWFVNNLEGEIVRIAKYEPKYPTFGKKAGHVLKEGGKQALYGGLLVGGAAVLSEGGLKLAGYGKGASPDPLMPEAMVLIPVGFAALGAIFGFGRSIGKSVSEIVEDKELSTYSSLAKSFMDAPKEIKYS
jgi:hypothetical protein